MQTVSNSKSNSQLGLWPLALGDNSHDSRSYLTRRQFESFVRRALFVVEVVIAVVLEDGLRHYRIALAERGRSVEDFASSVGHNVGFSVLDHIRYQYCDATHGDGVVSGKGGGGVQRTLFASFFKTSYACSTFTTSQLSL